MKLALAILITTAALLAPSTASATRPPDFWCVRYSNHGPGNSLYACWCLEWAQNHKICRVITWHPPKRQEEAPPTVGRG